MVTVIAQPQVAQAVTCSALTPDPSPAVNRSNIQACLTGGNATLTSGTFNVDSGITVGSNQILIGPTNPATWPTIKLATGNTSNFLVRFDGSNSRVAFLTLDGNNAFGNYANSSVVTFLSGGYNQLDNSHVMNAQLPTAGKKSTGVYLMGGIGHNQVLNNQIHNNFLGVIFAATFTSSTGSTVSGNRIYSNKCDGITLAGYGEVNNNSIHENGWDCENSIPGGGIYSLGNARGARIDRNEIYNTCGHGLDLHKVAYFTITGNNVHGPGYTWSGAYPSCGGAAAAFLVDIRESTIQQNTFTNDNRPNNRMSTDPNGVFSATGAAPLSDLPNGPFQTIAFVLAWDRNTAWTTAHNVIDANIMRSSCTSGCVGLGYFASRGTGYDQNGNWSAATTNYYTNNNPSGSSYGSKRCGGNWYAANTSSCGTQAPCNYDDSQHPTSTNWARNDGCYFY